MPSSDGEPTWAELDLWVHLTSHLRAQNGRSPYRPVLFVFDCWFPEALPPDWAIEAAQAIEPGWQWCPRISPDLLARVSARG